MMHGMPVSQITVGGFTFVTNLLGAGYNVTFGLGGTKQVPGAYGRRYAHQAQNAAKRWYKKNVGPWPTGPAGKWHDL
jgi:hypothetical protein